MQREKQFGDMMDKLKADEQRLVNMELKVRECDGYGNSISVLKNSVMQCV